MINTEDNYVSFIRYKALECVRRYCVPGNSLILALRDYVRHQQDGLF